MAVNIPALTVILLLLPLFYLLIASPSFLLVRLDIPQVARLMRAMFFGFFRALVVLGLIAATLNALDGRPFQVFVISSAAAFAILWQQWMMRRLDAVLTEILAGQEGAAARLRRLHLMGMGTNAILTATIVMLIPSLVVVV